MHYSGLVTAEVLLPNHSEYRLSRLQCLHSLPRIQGLRPLNGNGPLQYFSMHCIFNDVSRIFLNLLQLHFWFASNCTCNKWSESLYIRRFKNQGAKGIWKVCRIYFETIQACIQLKDTWKLLEFLLSSRSWKNVAMRKRVNKLLVLSNWTLKLWGKFMVEYFSLLNLGLATTYLTI
jgi:hypothetical protein